MKAHFFMPAALCMALSFSTYLAAQETERGRPARPDPSFGPREGDGDRRGDRERFDRMRNLAPEQRQKVREAFSKVWARPEVEQARETLRLANEAYRKTVEDALKAVDPEAAEILERHRPEPPHYQIPLAREAPTSQDAAALEATLQEIQSGLTDVLERTYKRQRGSEIIPKAQDVHAKILSAPTVKGALEAFKAGEATSTKRLWGSFRKAYLDELVRHLPSRSSSSRPGPRPEGATPHDRGNAPQPNAPKAQEKPAAPELPPAAPESL